MGTPELEARLLETLRLCRQFNEYPIPEEAATLTSLLGESRERLARIVGHVGKGSWARAPFNVSIGCNIWMGDNVALSPE